MKFTAMNTIAAGSRRALRIVAAGAMLLAQGALAVSPPPLESTQGMVVSSQHLASEVGADVLRSGGNAIDAAVAMGFALAVTHPCCGNLGGGGFMTIHLATASPRSSISARRRRVRRAPTCSRRPRQPGGGQEHRGLLAVGVPGTVLGLETARRRRHAAAGGH